MHRASEVATAQSHVVDVCLLIERTHESMCMGLSVGPSFVHDLPGFAGSIRAGLVVAADQRNSEE